MASIRLDTVLLPYFLVLPGICFGFVPDPMMVQVEPLLQEKVGNFTTIHPRNLPRHSMSLPAHRWTGPTHDDLPDALMHALTNGFAVLTDANAMFRVTKTKKRRDDDSSFTAQWFQNLRSRPDTTTIPHTSWLPRDTHHDLLDIYTNIYNMLLIFLKESTTMTRTKKSRTRASCPLEGHDDGATARHPIYPFPIKMNANFPSSWVNVQRQ